MSAVFACPDAAMLDQFVLGNASAAQMEEIASHLKNCSACAQRMDALRDQIAMLKAVCAGANQTADVARLAALSVPPEELVDPGATLASDGNTPAPLAETITSVGSPGAATDADYVKMLAPAQGPGELGRLGPFRVLKVLGAGGMGVVFLAEDIVLKRLVAVKAMKPEMASSSDGRARFLREAQTMATVKHQNVAVIHYAGEQGQIAFLAMEFLSGETLEDRLQRQGQLPLAEVLRIGRETAEGLAAAHAVGLIHRDIKPANLWLEKGQDQVKILDFGLARAAVVDVSLTQAGRVLGTPSYMAPEQAAGETVDARADLFSLGVVLYTTATGKLPFGGENVIQVLRAIALAQPEAPHLVIPKIPQGVSAVIMRLLAKSPSERFANAESLVARLRELERGEPFADPLDNHKSDSRTAAPARRFGIKARFGITGAAFAAFALVSALLLWSPWSSRQDPFLEMRRLEIEREIAVLKSSEDLVTKAHPPDYKEVDKLEPLDNSGFAVLSDDRIVDLRPWKAVPDDNPNEFHGAVVSIDRLRLKKVGSATAFYNDGRTSGRELFYKCLSVYPCHVTGQKGDTFVGNDRMKLRRLTVDVSSVPQGAEFELRYAVTRWNTAQVAQELWHGVVGYEGSFKVSMLLIFPKTKPFTDYKLMVSRTARDEPKPFEGRKIVLAAEDKGWIYWEIPSPDAGHVYRLHWSWQ